MYVIVKCLGEGPPAKQATSGLFRLSLSCNMEKQGPLEICQAMRSNWADATLAHMHLPHENITLE